MRPLGHFSYKIQLLSTEVSLLWSKIRLDASERLALVTASLSGYLVIKSTFGVQHS